MGVYVPTDVEIFNLALQRLGVTTGLVSAVDGSDTTFWGKQASLCYQFIRDVELRGEAWQPFIQRSQVWLAQHIDSGAVWTEGDTTMVVANSANISVGWVVANQPSALGIPNPEPPPGIPWNTTVVSITDATHVVLSAAPTASGSGTVVFMQPNKTGFWFVFKAPSSCIFLLDVYAVFPASMYQWPFKLRHNLRYQAIYEGGYIYTDNYDNSPGNPIAAYIAEPALGSGSFASDFAMTIALRIASWLCTPGNGLQPNLKNDIDAEYMLVRAKALGNSSAEREMIYRGEDWWFGPDPEGGQP